MTRIFGVLVSMNVGCKERVTHELGSVRYGKWVESVRESSNFKIIIIEQSRTNVIGRDLVEKRRTSTMVGLISGI